MSDNKPMPAEVLDVYKRELLKTGRLTENDILLLRWLKNPRYDGDDFLVDYPVLPGWEPYARLFSANYTLWDSLLWWSAALLPGEGYALSPDLPEATHNTDMGNATRLIHWYGASLLYCHPWRRWLVWDGRRWNPDDTANVVRLAKSTVRQTYAEASSHSDEKTRKETAKWAMRSESKERISAMIELAKSEVPVLPDQLDSDPWLLAVNNGVLDLRTGLLMAHDPALYITKLASANFDPTAECPRWLAFLDEIMPDSSTVKFLQRAIGYSLTGDTSERALFLMHGTGANGKTTLLEVIRAMMGDYAQRIPTETLLASKRSAGGATPDIARLRGARFVSASESEEGRRLAEAAIKDLTGGDTVTARPLYGQGFDFRPECKIWLATNHKPTIRGTDRAIWDRIQLLPFEVTIPEERQDKHLADKLKAELPGILAWAVEGCLAWQREGLGMADRVREATAVYRSEMDVLAGFIEDCCVEGPDLEALAGELYEAYKNWGGDLNQRRFGMSLRERGLEPGRDRKRGRFWRGLGLLETQNRDTMTEGDASFYKTTIGSPTTKSFGKKRHIASHPSHPSHLGDDPVIQAALALGGEVVKIETADGVVEVPF